MKIVVAIKQVPETRKVRMDEATGTVIREGVESIVNPLDLYAIATAIDLKKARGESPTELIAISMGPPKAHTALREALAMGLDSAVLISDRVFGGSDTWATSFILAKAIKHIGDVDLVLCGERATDGDTGQVGPGIAAWLNWPVMSYLASVSLDDDTCRVRRLVETGYEELTSTLPCVLTVVKEVAEPGLPTLSGKRTARRAEIAVWDHTTLGIEPTGVGLKGSPTRVVKIAKPTITRNCQLVHAADAPGIETAVASLSTFLADKGGQG